MLFRSGSGQEVVTISRLLFGFHAPVLALQRVNQHHIRLGESGKAKC